MKKKLNSRTIFIIANSSWYINHYRKYLLKELKRLDLYNVVTISPYDNYSKYLSKLSPIGNLPVCTLKYLICLLKLNKSLKSSSPSSTTIHSSLFFG